jgi:hypothetical protein
LLGGRGWPTWAEAGPKGRWTVPLVGLAQRKSKVKIDKAKTNRLQKFDFSNFLFKVGVQIKWV